MKNYLLFLGLIIAFASCENNTQQKSAEIKNPVIGSVYGNKINDSNIQNATILASALQNKDEKELKLEGNVEAVCQMTGCWLNMDMGNGENVHVTFKDEAFTLPKDIAGKNAVIEGIATKEDISVNEQKMSAKAEGKTQEEIDAINTIKTDYYFEATGVTIKEK